MKKVEFVRRQLKANPNALAGDIVAAWNQTPEGKKWPMELRVVYQERCKNKKDALKKEASNLISVSQASAPQQAPRAQLAKPVENTSFPHPGHIRTQLCVMEEKLESMIQEAKELKDHELAEAMRQCRRIVGKSILSKK